MNLNNQEKIVTDALLWWKAQVEELSCVLLETNLKSQKLSYLIVLVSCMYFVYVIRIYYLCFQLFGPKSSNCN